jgi:hypothetical protein
MQNNSEYAVKFNKLILQISKISFRTKKIKTSRHFKK